MRPGHCAILSGFSPLRNPARSASRSADLPRYAPTVVNGLRVVVQPSKLRLCMNPMYINAFIRYQPLRYERLVDLMHYVRPEDYLYATDDKSGYWQISMHPDSFRFIASSR